MLKNFFTALFISSEDVILHKFLEIAQRTHTFLRHSNALKLLNAPPLRTIVWLSPITWSVICDVPSKNDDTNNEWYIVWAIYRSFLIYYSFFWTVLWYCRNLDYYNMVKKNFYISCSVCENKYSVWPYANYTIEIG